MSCLGVLADDLTGAMDSGIQLMKYGYVVKVFFEYGNLSELSRDTDILIADTESRNISSSEAYKLVKSCAEELMSSGCQLVYKKIDSTLRGNIGAELEAVLSANEMKCVVIAPALPFNNRTTINGKHFVNGIQLQDTELARDPFSPIYESDISKIIARQSNAPVASINIETIRGGEEQTVNELSNCLTLGTQIVVMDAIDDGDLHCIARAAARWGNYVMLCGSAGLFQYMYEAICKQLQGRGNKIRHMPERKSGNPVLTLSGSPASISKAQIVKAVNENPRAALVRLDPAMILKGRDSETVGRERVLKEVLDLLNKGKHVIVDAAGEGKSAILHASGGDRNRLEQESKILQNILSAIAQEALKNIKLCGIALFGGDTAISVSRALGARGIEIIEEIEPYIPAGLLIGGEYNDLPVVTKAGGFGKEGTLVSILKMLE